MCRIVSLYYCVHPPPILLYRLRSQVFHHSPAREPQFPPSFPFCPSTMAFSSSLLSCLLGAGLGGLALGTIDPFGNHSRLIVCLQGASLTAKQANKSHHRGVSTLERFGEGGGNSLEKEGWIQRSMAPHLLPHTEPTTSSKGCHTSSVLPNCRGRPIEQPLPREPCLNSDGSSSIGDITFGRHQSEWESHSRWFVRCPGPSGAANQAADVRKATGWFFLL